MLPGNTLIDHHESLQAPLRTFLLLFKKQGFVHKFLSRDEFGYPSQPGLNWRCTVINIITVEAISHFKAECIPCPQANWFDAKLLTGFEDSLPETARVRILNLSLIHISEPTRRTPIS